jgi:hypothetical protein
MEIKYQFFEKENLLVQKFIGIFSIDHYISFNRFLMKSHGSKNIKKVLIDFRDMNFHELTEDLPDDFTDHLDKITEVRKNINKNDLKNKDITLVLWVDKPIPTVIAHLFTANFPSLDYNYSSTEENILNILKIPKTPDDLKNIINNLENSF